MKAPSRSTTTWDRKELERVGDILARMISNRQFDEIRRFADESSEEPPEELVGFDDSPEWEDGEEF